MDAKTLAAFLASELQAIKGKKAFQKFVYLAKAHGIPIKHAFKMHYYGPYSESLAEEFEAIYYEDVIDKAPGSEYVYVSTLKTRKVLDECQEEIIKHLNELDKLILRFGDMSPRELEIFATAHLVWRINTIFNRSTDKHAVIEETKKAKYPKFSIVEIEQAYDKLVEWSLITIKQ